MKTSRKTKKRREEQVLEGLGVAPGVAIGPAHVREAGDLQVPEYQIPAGRVKAEKARLAEASRLITNEGLQMHGGVGMTDEFDVGLFMKRARVAAVTFGDANYHRNRYAELDGY